MDVRLLQQRKTESNVGEENAVDGSNNNQTLNAIGTVLHLTCHKGYKLSIPKRKVRCKRGGEWRPALPECIPLKCRLPRIFEGGKFKLDNILLPNEGEIEHGRQVHLECDEGYHRAGPEIRRCWYGEWTGSAETPKCVGDPCKLRPIAGGGRYLGNGGNYRPGQMIPHAAQIEFECDEVKNVVEPLICRQGRLLPEEPECFVAGQQRTKKVKKATLIGVDEWSASLAYSASTHLIKNGDMAGVMDSANGIPSSGFSSTSLGLMRPRASCAQPARLDGSLVYRTPSHDPITLVTRDVIGPGGQTRFPHGTEVKFDCLPAAAKTKKEAEERRSGNSSEEILLRGWKIVCEDGHWTGHSQGCDENGQPSGNREEEEERRKASFNASCAYTAPEESATSVVVFQGDKQLTPGEEHHFDPGVELVYRCRDIGERANLL